MHHPTLLGEDGPPEKGLEKYVPEFLADRRKELEEMRQALSQRNFKQISAKAHAWRGYSGPYGFHRLGRMARALEEGSQLKDVGECEQILQCVEIYLLGKEALD